MGSSKSSRFAPLKSIFANWSLAFCPPERTPTLFPICSSVSPRPIRADRARERQVSPPPAAYSSLSRSWRRISSSISSLGGDCKRRFETSSSSLSMSVRWVNTVMTSSKAVLWRSRQTCCSIYPGTVSLENMAEPVSGEYSPVRVLNSVVLPEPFTPTRPTCSPFCSSKLMFSIMVSSPKARDISETVRIAILSPFQLIYHVDRPFYYSISRRFVK